MTVRDSSAASTDPVWRRLPAARRRLLAVLPFLFILFVASATRFLLIGHQSLWFDEIVSATLAKQPFGDMLHEIARTESTPPLYYIFAWAWVHLFGTTAVALRSLSACTGALAVVVIYLTGRMVFPRPAAFVAALLAATHPMLIWYSQENRAYSLLTLLVSLSLYFFFRARSDASMRNLVAWALSGSLAIATHYFAVFVIFPEAALLLYLHRNRFRRLLLATALPVATAAALLPLAIHQRDTGNTRFIAKIPLKSRVYDTLNELLLGRYALSALYLASAGLVIAAAAAIRIRRRASADEQHAVLLLVVLGFAALVLPLVLSSDFFFYRNLIVVLPPFLLVAGAAFAPREAGTGTVLAGSLASAALLFPTALVAERPSLQREDWRQMATLIDKGDTARAILTYPRFEYVALRYYHPGLEVVTAGKLRISELVLVGRPRLAIHRLPRGFRRVEDIRLGTLRLVRLRSAKLRQIDVSALHLRATLRLLRVGGDKANAKGQDATLLVERSQRDM